ncbi:hypothetical protein V6N13_064595 [Hibiscus sabdariffa]|uniref:Uncharacterized protein n=1 Tax=Hibiscus sabdariffa TaxID=183260 RepID=A0ABR2EAY6_9ROSI
MLGFHMGKSLHCHVLRFGFYSNVSVQNALIHKYSLCGHMEMPCQVKKDEDFEYKSGNISLKILTEFSQMLDLLAYEGKKKSSIAKNIFPQPGVEPGISKENFSLCATADVTTNDGKALYIALFR